VGGASSVEPDWSMAMKLTFRGVTLSIGGDGYDPGLRVGGGGIHHGFYLAKREKWWAYGVLLSDRMNVWMEVALSDAATEAISRSYIADYVRGRGDVEENIRRGQEAMERLAEVLVNEGLSIDRKKDVPYFFSEGGRIVRVLNGERSLGSFVDGIFVPDDHGHRPGRPRPRT